MFFAHIADTHLGYRQFNLEEREKDFYSAFEESVDRMISEGVEVVLHAGDLFDEPRPPIKALVEAKKGIERLKAKGIRIVMIPGNHDIIMRKGSMAPHALFDGVDVLTVDNPSVVMDDVFIAGLPYLPKSYRDVLTEKIDGLGEEAADFKSSILLLHQGTDKHLFNQHEIKMEELPESFDYYAMGHIHSRIEERTLGGVLCYPGSTEMWRGYEMDDWEKNGKGFLVSDTKDFKPKRIDLQGLRPFMRGDIAGEADIAELKTRLTGDKKPVVVLTIESGQDFNRLHEKAREELSDGALYLSIKKKATPREELIVQGGALDMKELIFDSLKEMGEKETAYAYSMFRELSKSNLEEALELTENFYQKWKGDPTAHR